MRTRDDRLAEVAADVMQDYAEAGRSIDRHDALRVADELIAEQERLEAEPISCAYCLGRHATTAELEACAAWYYRTAPLEPNPERQ